MGRQISKADILMSHELAIWRRIAGLFLGATLVACSNYGSNASPESLNPSLQTTSQLTAATRKTRISSSQALFYVTGYADGNVYEYTYPQDQLVGTLTGFIYPEGECVDSAGDVFIVARADTTPYSTSVIYEYAHGGTTPIATLSDPSRGVGCAIDPSSGDLAVSGGYVSSGVYGDVAVFTQAQGTPTTYYSATLAPFQLCGYDAKGNLYISGDSDVSANQYLLIRLSHRSNTFEQLSLDQTLYGSGTYPPSVQWDGKHMTVSSASAREDNPSYIYQLNTFGGRAKTVGTTTLRSDRGKYRTGQISIYGTHVLSSHYKGGAGGVDLWSYPNARKAHTLIRKAPRVYPWGLVVSGA